jgi:hypothetical protein
LILLVYCGMAKQAGEKHISISDIFENRPAGAEAQLLWDTFSARLNRLVRKCFFSRASNSRG